MPKAAKIFRPKRLKGKTRENRGTPDERGYDGPWRRFRATVIGSNPAKWLRCADCKEYASDPSGIHLDHIIPLSQGGPRLDVDNLQPLCPSCHSSKTAKENMR